MSNVLIQAYRTLLGADPNPDMQEWELAQTIVHQWTVPLLGEELAREYIFCIVNHVMFPTPGQTREIVGLVEDKATELFPELEGVDPHMDVIAHLERRYHEQNKKENSELKPR